jgi:hypothetical protein
MATALAAMGIRDRRGIGENAGLDCVVIAGGLA